MKYRSVFSILLSFVLLSIAGCKKNGTGSEDSANGYYLRAKLNGELTDFSNGAGVSFMGDDGRISVIDLGGFSGVYPKGSHNVEDEPPELEIDCWTPNGANGDIKPGTYTGKDDFYSPRCQYIKQTKNGTLIHVSGEDFILTIQEISKTKGIRGTFSGRLTLDDGDVIMVTDGEMNLPSHD